MRGRRGKDSKELQKKKEGDDVGRKGGRGTGL